MSYVGEARAQALAVQQINNDASLLPDYDIELIQAFDDCYFCNYHWEDAVRVAIDTVTTMRQEPSNNSSITIPIVLGPSTSSEVTATGHIFYANHIGTLSDSAASVALSDTYLYPYFYRVIPDDHWQCSAIIELCKHFGWDTIAVLYVDSAWSMYIANGILELSAKNNISAHSVSFSRSTASFQEKAAFIKSLNTYIIILIAYTTYPTIFKTLKEENLWGYPYYYIGMADWFNPDMFNYYGSNSSEELGGYIGVSSWRPHSLSDGDYEEIKLIHDNAVFYQDLLHDLWTQMYNDSLSAWALYGWDSMYTLAHALDRYDKLYSLDDIDEYTDVLARLDDIIKYHVQFVGATGNVSFDGHGNRESCIYNYANVLPNGTFRYFGYFYNNDIKINPQDIVWPSYFNDKGIIPRSRKVTTYELISIDPILFAVVCALVALSVVFVFVVIWAIIYFRKEPLLIAGSWRLNLFVCIGSLLCYAQIILQGIDEGHVHRGESVWIGLCNTRIWLLCIAFSVIFMPLFMKTYRLARIFSSMNVQTLQDYKLIIAVIVCVLIDVALLSVFTVMDPLDRKYKIGTTVTIDVLQDTQYEFGECTRHNETLLYFVMGLWKLLQLTFGVYVAVIVSRIGMKQLIKFDETGQQIFAITFTTFATAMIVTYAVASSNSDRVNEKYAIKSLGVWIICNVSLIVNTCSRLHATYRAKIKHDDSKLKQFEETFEATMLKMIEIQMENIQRRRRTLMGSINMAHQQNTKRTNNLELPTVTSPNVLLVPSDELSS
eukprot:67113_1